MKCICPNCKTEFDAEKAGHILLPLGHRVTLAFEVREMVCRFYDVKIEDAIGKKRYPEIVAARQVGMYLIYNFCHLSLRETGILYGNRDHSTVINGLKRCQNSLQTKSDLFSVIIELSAKVDKMARKNDLNPAA